MAAKNTKPTELTDIPLTLEQGDSVGMNTSKPDKMKSNSLKRFFRTAKSGSTASMQKSTVSSDANSESAGKLDGPYNMRIGSFRRGGGVLSEDIQASDELGASSSVDRRTSKLQSGSESRLNLQERLSSFWNTVFKKSSKKSVDVKEDATQDADIVPSNELNQIEQNQPENL